jgi:hypothetical protein
MKEVGLEKDIEGERIVGRDETPEGSRLAAQLSGRKCGARYFPLKVLFKLCPLAEEKTN